MEVRLTRYGDGPILSPDDAYPWEREGVFNPGVVATDEGIVMLYRAVGEKEAYVSHLGLATSTDGYAFTRASREPVFGPSQPFDMWATEDPRITKVGDDYYVTYVAVPQRILQDGAPFPHETPLQTSTALLRTSDFRTFENLGIISPPGSDDKDTVLFPRAIGGRYAMLHRPHTWSRQWCADHASEEGGKAWPCSDPDALPERPAIWLSRSDDLLSWDSHQAVLPASHRTDAKIGAGMPPLETPYGWLVVYHHVTELPRKDAFEYSVRAALFDLEDPSKLIGKLPYDLLKPERPYELEQNSPIVFPTGGFIKDDTLFVYYGASDRYIGLATCPASALLEALRSSL